MAPKMLQFTHIPHHQPAKRSADVRTDDFDEITAGFLPVEAQSQASRCEQCGIPFCQVHCPLHNNIPDWLMLTAAGRMEEAWAIASSTNTFPEITGRICPQDRLCEGSCVLEQSGHNTVSIGSVEKYIGDFAFANGWVEPPRPQQERPQSIGIIGGGPAGLAAAEYLRSLGYSITVYDRHDRIGGLLIYGIPGFKLEKSLVERRVRLLAESGISFLTGVEVGRDVSFEELRRRHDAVLVATGVYQARPLGVPGEERPNVLAALDYLIASNRRGLGDRLPSLESGNLDASGKHVVVIGGGDTAMDCVRTAVRQGAKSVKCLYRRDRANMPGSNREVTHAEEEGVTFLWQAAPLAIEERSVRALRIHLGTPDASGRRAPTPIEGSDFTIEADLVIKALGFDPQNLPRLFSCPDLLTDRSGAVRIDAKTKMTSEPGVFAAGDIVRGASLVVWAIRDGRDAAASIHNWLQQQAVAA